MSLDSSKLSIYLRIISYSVLAFTLAFLINNVLTVWNEWPGIKKIFAHHELFGFKKKALEGSALNYGYSQVGIYLFCIIPYTLEILLAVMPPSHHRCTQFLERLWNSQQLIRSLRDSSKLKSLRSRRACHCARSTMDCLSLSARDRPVRRGQWAKTEPAVELIVRAGWPNMATRLHLSNASHPRSLSIAKQPFAAHSQHPSPPLALTFSFGIVIRHELQRIAVVGETEDDMGEIKL